LAVLLVAPVLLAALGIAVPAGVLAARPAVPSIVATKPGADPRVDNDSLIVVSD
jgi:hypothetical protein